MTAPSATPRTESGDWPTPAYAQRIQFEGCDCVVMSPESYEALYTSHGQLETELARVTAELDKANERLENNHAFSTDGRRIECAPGEIPDGIDCRNETIKLQDELIDELKATIARVTGELAAEKTNRLDEYILRTEMVVALNEKLSQMTAERDEYRELLREDRSKAIAAVKAERDAALADAITALRDELDAVLAQLPDGMKHRTIRFVECDKGHGRLTADNWVQHECLVCQRDAALADARRLEVALRGLVDFAARVAIPVGRIPPQLQRAIDLLAERDAAMKEHDDA